MNYVYIHKNFAVDNLIHDLNKNLNNIIDKI